MLTKLLVERLQKVLLKNIHKNQYFLKKEYINIPASAWTNASPYYNSSTANQAISNTKSDLKQKKIEVLKLNI